MRETRPRACWPPGPPCGIPPCWPPPAACRAGRGPTARRTTWQDACSSSRKSANRCSWPAGRRGSRAKGATSSASSASRPEIVANALAELDGQAAEVRPDRVADFFALGLAYLQVELLTRQMRYMSNLDEVHFQAETLRAAEAAVAGDEEARAEAPGQLLRGAHRSPRAILSGGSVPRGFDAAGPDHVGTPRCARSWRRRRR